VKEVRFYKKLDNGKVQCFACRRFCTISEGAAGKCGVRKNIDGKLFSLVYGKTLSMAVDPIEKKPLFHFKPGSYCLGISTYGCNFFCAHCQNADISQQRSEEAIAKIPDVSPKEIVERTLEQSADGIAYTYTEPTVFVEYALDTMKLARKKKLYNVWVSNGYFSKEVVEEIAPFLDAINIDLKGDETFYREICGNVKMKFVQENIKLLHGKGVHVEVTNLVVPGFNDKEESFQEIVGFVKSVSSEMPLHFSRFYPMHKMKHLPPTDESKLHHAQEIARSSGLKYVYLGNIGEEENTSCPLCGELLVKRIGYAAELCGLDEKGKCKKCGAEAGIKL